MFDWFKKKKQPTLLDALAHVMNEQNPQAEPADARKATGIASEMLLFNLVPTAEIATVVRDLIAGPLPYSTHDLAYSAAMNFFKKPELKDRLFDGQIMARLFAQKWVEEGTMNPMLASAYEATLYRIYGPNTQDKAENQNNNEVDETNQQYMKLMEEYSEFLISDEVIKLKSMTSPLDDQNAISKINKFFATQHNNLTCVCLSLNEDGDLDDEDRVIERAYLNGAAMLARYLYSVPYPREGQRDLFPINVVGRIWATTEGDPEDVAKQMDIDAVEYPNAFSAGYRNMLQFIKNGSCDGSQFDLTYVCGYDPEEANEVDRRDEEEEDFQLAYEQALIPENEDWILRNIDYADILQEYNALANKSYFKSFGANYATDSEMLALSHVLHFTSRQRDNLKFAVEEIQDKKIPIEEINQKYLGAFLAFAYGGFLSVRRAYNMESQTSFLKNIIKYIPGSNLSKRATFGDVIDAIDAHPKIVISGINTLATDITNGEGAKNDFDVAVALGFPIPREDDEAENLDL